MSKGRLFIMSGPSCAGKNTVFKQLKLIMPHIGRIITTTTRDPRSNEIPDEDYYFKTVTEFREMIENGEIIEYNYFDEALYGTTQKAVENGFAQYDVLFAIVDVNGAEALGKIYPDSVSIFIMPPSPEELARRIVERGENSPEEIERRLKKANEEMKCAGRFDHVFVNIFAEKTALDISKVITGDGV